MPAGHGVPLGPEVFGEFAFHLEGGFEGHGVEDLVKLGHEAKAEEFDDARGFQTAFVILKSLFGRKAGHTDVDARLGRIAIGIGGADFREAGCLGREENNVNVVMVAG